MKKLMAKQTQRQKGKGRQQAKSVVTLKQKFIDFIKELGLVLVIFLVINSFVLASFEVPTGSMENTVMSGDFLFVWKVIYGGTSPRNIPLTNIRLPYFRLPGYRDVQRGDVIVFEWPGNRDDVEYPDVIYYLKRCVALPGDTLEIIDKVLYINHQRAPIPKYAKFEKTAIIPKGERDYRIFPRGTDFNEDNYGPIRIPKKGDTIALTPNNILQWETFIKREKHTVSVSRNGEIKIDGKATTFYVVERDYYFGMGDNRDNSLDSRFWGFIPKENIVGTPVIVYWSWNPNIPLSDIVDKIGSIKWHRIATIIK